MKGPSTTNKKSNCPRLVTGLQCCKKSRTRKVQKGDCNVPSSQKITNMSASEDRPPNERSFSNTCTAPPPENDTNVEVINLYDGGCSSSDIKDTQYLKRDNSLVVKSERQNVVGTAREQPLKGSVLKVDEENLENNDTEKGGMDCTVKGMKMISSDNDPEQLLNIEENVTSDIHHHEECQKRNSSKSMKKEKKVRTTRGKVSTNLRIDKFTKTYSPTTTSTNTLSKMDSRCVSSDHSKCTDSHCYPPADLDSILLEEEKLKKKVCEVVNELSPSLLCEPERKTGMQNKPQETQVENRNLLDTQKLRGLFSLKDSGRLDLIKPSMLKRNSQENVSVTSSHMDNRHKTCIEPNHKGSLEICSRKKSKTERCNTSSCHERKDFTRKQDFPVNSTKRQKIAAKGDSLTLGSESNNCDKTVSFEEMCGKVGNPISMKSNSISDCLPGKCITTICTTDLDACSNTEQVQKLDEDRHSPTKQTKESQEKMSCSNREPEVLLCSTPVTKSVDQQRHENNLKVDKRCNIRKRLKRKCEFEWDEAVDHIHPRKKKMVNNSKKCVIDSECEVRKTPTLNNDNSSLPPPKRALQEVECDHAARNSKTQNSDCNEQEINEVEDTSVLKHLKDSHPKLSKLTKTFEFVEKVQVENCQEIQNQSKNFLLNCDSLLHKTVPSRIENLHESVNPDSIERNNTEKAKRCRPDKGGKLHGICGAVSRSESESPSPQSQLSNSVGTAKEVTHNCSPEVIGAASSTIQGQCSGLKSPTGILCSDGFLVEHSKAIITENDSVNLQCESHHYMNKCDEVEKGQKPASHYVTTLQPCASDEPLMINDDSSNVHGDISQSKEICFFKDDGKLISVSSLQKQLKDNLKSAEESKYKKEIHPTNSALPEMKKTSVTSSPCPKVLAKRTISNIRYCIFKVNSSSGSGLLGFNKKYEYLPILQASVQTFFIKQNNPKPSKQCKTRNSLFPQVLSHGHEKVVLEKILMKMRLQLVIDANLVNDVGQHPMSSSMETFALFIEGQMASPSQATNLAEALDNTRASVAEKDLSPQCVKSPIAQQVSELHCPYKMSKMRTFYRTSCRIMVSSAIFNHGPADQGAPMRSSPGDCWSPQEAGQQHCLPISFKNDPVQENSSAISFSSLLQENHNNKIPKTNDRTMFIPNEFYQPCLEDFPYQPALDGYHKFIHFFQGMQQDIIKLKVRILKLCCLIIFIYLLYLFVKFYIYIVQFTRIHKKIRCFEGGQVSHKISGKF